MPFLGVATFSTFSLTKSDGEKHVLADSCGYHQIKIRTAQAPAVWPEANAASRQNVSPLFLQSSHVRETKRKKKQRSWPGTPLPVFQLVLFQSLPLSRVVNLSVWPQSYWVLQHPLWASTKIRLKAEVILKMCVCHLFPLFSGMWTSVWGKSPLCIYPIEKQCSQAQRTEKLKLKRLKIEKPQVTSGGKKMTKRVYWRQISLSSFRYAGPYFYQTQEDINALRGPFWGYWLRK